MSAKIMRVSDIVLAQGVLNGRAKDRPVRTGIDPIASVGEAYAAQGDGERPAKIGSGILALR